MTEEKDETMEKYMNSPIKEVITAFPAVGKILEEYHIGCVPCAVGTCLLKDIIEIHQLPREEGQEMLARLAKVIYPDREIELPEPTARRQPGGLPRQITYSPPMKQLVDEHKLIKEWVGLIPEFLKDLDLDSPQDCQLTLEGVYFIRNYADKFHHAKEEEILFKSFDQNLDIIKVMHEDHENARGHARAIEEAVGRKDRQTVAEHLIAYRELLTEHIRKEDEVLYPWMDGKLSIRQVGDLFSKFGVADEGMDKGVIQRCLNFVTDLKRRLQKPRKEV